MPTVKDNPAQRLTEMYFLLRLQQLLTLGRTAFHELLLKLRRDYVFMNGRPLPENELKLWLEFVETSALPNNSQIALFIVNNITMYSTLPAPFADFLEYHDSWLTEHSAWRADPTVKYSFHARRNFPQSIDTWVIQRLELLRHELCPSMTTNLISWPWRSQATRSRG